MASNYPPGGGLGVYPVGLVDQGCINKHRWQAAMFTELGGCFYEKDDDSSCPECGSDDILNQYEELLSDDEREARRMLDGSDWLSGELYRMTHEEELDGSD